MCPNPLHVMCDAMFVMFVMFAMFVMFVMFVMCVMFVMFVMLVMFVCSCVWHFAHVAGRENSRARSQSQSRAHLHQDPQAVRVPRVPRYGSLALSLRYLLVSFSVWRCPLSFPA